MNRSSKTPPPISRRRQWDRRSDEVGSNQTGDRARMSAGNIDPDRPRCAASAVEKNTQVLSGLHWQAVTHKVDVNLSPCLSDLQGCAHAGNYLRYSLYPLPQRWKCHGPIWWAICSDGMLRGLWRYECPLVTCNAPILIGGKPASAGHTTQRQRSRMTSNSHRGIRKGQNDGLSECWAVDPQYRADRSPRNYSAIRGTSFRPAHATYTSLTSYGCAVTFAEAAAHSAR